MTPRALAAYWDGLIAAHVRAGDEVGDVAFEFGLHPATVIIVAEKTTEMELARWHKTQNELVRRAA